MNNPVKFPIDVVVTWVNGNDLEYQKKLSDYKKIEKSNKAVLNSHTGTIEIHSIKKKSLTTIKNIIKSCEMDSSVFSINIQDMNLASNKTQKFLLDWIQKTLK